MSELIIICFLLLLISISSEVGPSVKYSISISITGSSIIISVVIVSSELISIWVLFNVISAVARPVIEIKALLFSERWFSFLFSLTTFPVIKFPSLEFNICSFSFSKSLILFSIALIPSSSISSLSSFSNFSISLSVSYSLSPLILSLFFLLEYLLKYYLQSSW